MSQDSTLRKAREHYAKLVTESVGVNDLRVRAAFARVARELFVGDGPWLVLGPTGYITTRTANPEMVYQDVVISLASELGINNGEPSLHAQMLASVSPKPGERVLHIGAGTGYYTALLAELVERKGRILALEIEPTLAEHAKKNLVGYPGVTVECRSGSVGPLPISDVIYVCAGATEPLLVWLNALSPNGRLIFPLTPGRDVGAMLLITQVGDGKIYNAKFVTAASFIPCVGGQSESEVEALKEAFEGGNEDKVRTLNIGFPNGETAWYAGKGWWLSS